MSLFNFKFTYSINKKIVLRNVEGTIPNNSLTCILGKSGAGKTSLIEILSGRSHDGIITGTIKFNSKDINIDELREKIGYVHQDNLLCPDFTVFELFNLCYRLKMPHLNKDQINNRLHNLLRLLRLIDCKDTIIGATEEKGISGGEKKRVSIGLELISEPNILFLDEPISGLDAYNAYNIMSILKNLVKNGKSVVAVIHQPSSEIFNSIDHLIVMNNKKIIYCDERYLLIEFMSSLNKICPKYVNPADFLFMRILNNQRTIIQIEDSYKVKHYARSNTTESTIEYEKPESNIIKKVLNELNILTLRFLKEFFRNKMAFKFKVIQNIFTALTISLIYLDLGISQEDVQNRIGVLFYISINIFMSSLYGILTIFFSKKSIYFREYQSGWYSYSTFYLSKIVTEIPMNIISALLLSTITYYLVGFQQSEEKFLNFLLVIFVSINCGNAIGFFLSSLFSNIGLTMAFVPTLTMPMMIFSGFFINNRSIPAYFDWFKYLSPIKYTFNALALNEFDNIEFECNLDESNKYKCFYKNSDDVIQYLNFDSYFTIKNNIIFMLIIYVFFNLLTYLILRRKIIKKMNKPYKNINKSSVIFKLESTVVDNIRQTAI